MSEDDPKERANLFPTRRGFRDMPKLGYNPDSGEGYVVFPDIWEKMAYIWKIDCLRDWFVELEDEYDRIREEERKNYERRRSSQT